MPVPESVTGKITKLLFLDHAKELNKKRFRVEPVNAVSPVNGALTLPDVDTAQLHRLALRGSVIDTPTGVGTTAATTGGVLAAGATYSYRVSAINDLGETLASAAVTQAIAAALAAPVVAAPTTATTGGTLAAATYFYQVTATNALGETVGSNEVSITTTGGTSTVSLSWAAITGATGYKVYRATATGGTSTSPALLATLGNVTGYTDTGAAVAAGAVPATNTTATATNTVTVSWTAVTRATGYRVYGRTANGELLIATVGTVTSYVDAGNITPAGGLPASNTTSPNVPVTLPPAVAGKSLVVLLAQDAVGGRPVTIVPAGADTIVWRGGALPTFTTPGSQTQVDLTCFVAGRWDALGVDSFASRYLVSSVQTGAYTLALADDGKIVEIDAASGATVTVPTNAAVPFPLGTVIEVYQSGAGQVTIGPATGVTIRAAGGTKVSARYASVVLRKRAADEWVLSGSAVV